MLKRSLATVAVLAGLLAAAAPAHASKNEVSIETLETRLVFSGDAYDNEMGVASRRPVSPASPERSVMVRS